MTKKLLLGLGGVAVIAAATSTVVSCSDTETTNVKISKITYNKKGFDLIKSKLANEKTNPEGFVAYVNDSKNYNTFKEIFTLEYADNQTGENSIAIVAAVDKTTNVKLTVTAVSGFEINSGVTTEFIINFETGEIVKEEVTPEPEKDTAITATYTFDSTKWEAFKTVVKGEGATEPTIDSIITYVTANPKEATLLALFTIDPVKDNAFTVAAEKATVNNKEVIKFTLTAATGFKFETAPVFNLGLDGKIVKEEAKPDTVINVAYTYDKAKWDAFIAKVKGTDANEPDAKKITDYINANKTEATLLALFTVTTVTKANEFAVEKAEVVNTSNIKITLKAAAGHKFHTDTKGTFEITAEGKKPTTVITITSITYDKTKWEAFKTVVKGSNQKEPTQQEIADHINAHKTEPTLLALFAITPTTGTIKVKEAAVDGTENVKITLEAGTGSSFATNLKSDFTIKASDGTEVTATPSTK